MDKLLGHRYFGRQLDIQWETIASLKGRFIINHLRNFKSK